MATNSRENYLAMGNKGIKRKWKIKVSEIDYRHCYLKIGLYGILSATYSRLDVPDLIDSRRSSCNVDQDYR